MSDSPTALPPLTLPPPVSDAGADGRQDQLPAQPGTALADAWLVPRSWALGVAVLAAGGLAFSLLLWQKLGSIQEELARRTLDSGAQAVEARTLAREAQAGSRDLLARLALQETRLAEVSLQRSQLDELMQSVARSRDENLVVDIESDLRLAQQQALLSGNAEPLLAALRSADTRLSRAAQPRLGPLQRAVVRDLERIKSASVADVPALTRKLDELARQVDDLPVANDMINTAAARALQPGAAQQPAASAAPASVFASTPSPTPTSWLSDIDLPGLQNWLARLLASVRAEAGQLLRVSRIDQPDAALLAPEQAFFLRENLKLRLLNARLALLSRQSEAARTDLVQAGNWLARYFDPAARRTQAALQLLAQVQTELRSTDLPRLDETMAALSTAAAGR